MKTSELIDEKLDWAVVKASGQNAEYWLEKYASEDRRCMCESPSTDWSQGGPIIEGEKITVGPCDIHEQFRAYTHIGCYTALTSRFTQDDPTPLITAMRNYIASKLGDEVEIPEELT